MMKVTLILRGLCCTNCASKIENYTNKLATNVTLNFNTSKLVFEVEEINMEEVVTKIINYVKDIEPDVVVKRELKLNKVHFKENNNVEHGHHNHVDDDKSSFKKIIRFVIAFILLVLTYLIKISDNLKFIVFIVSYLIIGYDILLQAVKNIIKGRVFDENFLMVIATIGAFCIKEYPEAVGVMLFYQAGEFFQDLAVNKSRKSIATLMDIKPDFAIIRKGNELVKVSPEEVNINDFILVRPGEKIPLDGVIIEGTSSVDTKSLTGESLLRDVLINDEVLSGFININSPLTIKVTKVFEESAVSKILELVENASNKKANTEKFITKFARVYTPLVTIGAILLAIIPWLFFKQEFSIWLYRALELLVISCPCALVISIPLSYFGGIGLAGKKGILIKGSSFLEELTLIDTVVFDKTGTLTKGVFKVTQINTENFVSKEELLEVSAYCEIFSNHPIAISIKNEYKKKIDTSLVTNYNEILGQGISCKVKDDNILIGNQKLMDNNNIIYKKADTVGTVLYVSKNSLYIGNIIIEDEIKKDSFETISQLKNQKIKTVMLTGDYKNVALKVNEKLMLDEVYYELLPQDKVKKFEQIKGKKLFVGDGINDAPVLALSDVGVAMGALGSDAAIEAADVVLMTDEPMAILKAIRIAKITKRIIWQNIIFALAVKLVFILLGSLGLITMWFAVFADVGVALIAILNTMRILKK